MTEDLGGSSTGKVYEQASSVGSEGLYDNWAEKYDADNATLGFRLPVLACAFAARHFPLDSGPILDAAAGTGQVGSAMQVLGFDHMIGCDMSEQMLAVAARTGAYSQLSRQVLGETLSYAGDVFAGVVCSGSFGPGHAPPETFDELIRVACPGAAIVFNVREDTWKEQGFATKIKALTDANLWTLLEERGPFRPYIVGEPELFARFFVFRVA